MITYVSLREGEGGAARIEKLSPEEPDLLLSLREAGDMTDEANRRRIAGPRNPAPVTVRQVHSRRVLWASGGEPLEEEPAGRTAAGRPPAAERLAGRRQATERPATEKQGTERPATERPATEKQGTERPEADGLLSTDPGTTLGVTVADCMPVYLFGPGVTGMLHSGWKGTGIVSEALRLIRRELSIEASRMTAVLGPSIRSCCYEVDGERAELFSSMWGKEAVRVGPDGGAFYLDLLRANLDLLQAEGVEEIRVVDACTMCDESFGSFRREGPETFTHMLAMIGYLQ